MTVNPSDAAPARNVHGCHPTLAALVTEKAQLEPDGPILNFVSVEADGALRDKTRSFRQPHDNAR